MSKFYFTFINPRLSNLLPHSSPHRALPAASLLSWPSPPPSSSFPSRVVPPDLSSVTCFGIICHDFISSQVFLLDQIRTLIFFHANFIGKTFPWNLITTNHPANKSDHPDLSRKLEKLSAIILFWIFSVIANFYSFVRNEVEASFFKTFI